jgi:hypothetical protein
MRSYIVEVQTDNTGQWYSNYLRFPTSDEATDYGHDLSRRWLAVKDWRVSEIHEPANYNYTQGQIVPYRKEGM